jgi:putative DNA-invertase from lambdoid prophage Rac
MKQHIVYYGRICTTDGQTAATQHEEATELGIKPELLFIDEGVSGYDVAPKDRPEGQKALMAARLGGLLVVRWLDRISRRHDELATVETRRGEVSRAA